MIDKPVRSFADKATDSDAFEYTARAGFAVSGVLHLIVGYIVLRIAFGAGGSADQSGALATLAAQTGGTLIMWVVAAGLVALGLWRVAEAVVGSKPGEGSGPRQDDTPVWKRAKSLGLAIVNFAIALAAARFAMGSGQSSSQQNAGLSAQMMQTGWGKAVLIAIGLGLIGVGGYHVYKGVSKKFFKDLRVRGGTAITGIGITGYVAKGLAIAGAGLLVLVATIQADPRRRLGSTPPSRHWVRHRSARSFSFWPGSESPRSACTTSSAAATAGCDYSFRASNRVAGWLGDTATPLSASAAGCAPAAVRTSSAPECVSR